MGCQFHIWWYWERDRLTWSTLTTSSAIAMIHTIATKKPMKQRAILKVGWSPFFRSANTDTRTAAAIPAIELASKSHI